MSAFAVGTPPRNHNNANNHQRLKNNVIYNDKENILNPDFFAYSNIDFVI